MMSLDTLMGCICTDAVEKGPVPAKPSDLPLIRFELELIEDSNGHLHWVE